MAESYPLAKPRPAPRYAARRAVPDDFAFAWALYSGLMREMSHQLGLWHEPVQREMIRAAMSSAGTDIILAGEEPVGWVQVQETSEAVFVHHLYIAAEHQRRGVGTRMLKKILKDARLRGKPVHLWVIRNNPRARQLYQRLGFTIVDEDKVKFHLVSRRGAPPS